MRTIRRILVAVKDAESRSVAVIKAAQLAQAFGARLELFHAIDAPMYTAAYAAGKRERIRLQELGRAHCHGPLDTIAAQLARHGITATATVVWDYPVYEAILRQAMHSKADMVVAERHADRHVAPWMLHVTDWELLRRCDVPLLLVKSPRPYHRPVVLATIDPIHRHAKPAQLDEEILRVATTVAEALRGTLHAAHAYVPLPLTTFFCRGIHLVSDDRLARVEAAAKAAARAGFKVALRSSRLPNRRRHLIAGEPAAVIPIIAGELHSAIVVIGAVSRSALKHLLIGSTAASVLDRLGCDLLVVKPEGFVSRVHRLRRGVRLISPMTAFP